MSDINSEIGNLTSAIEHLENTLRQSFVHSTPKPDTQARSHYLYQTFPTINLLTSYNDKFFFSNLLTLQHNK
jgi:hypothetical protein